MCGFNKKWHSNRKRIAMEQSSISRVRSQGSDRTGHRVAKIVMRAGDRAGSGALPGVRRLIILAPDYSLMRMETLRR